MIKLFLDIETLPGDELVRQQIAEELSPVGNTSRPGRIEQWEAEEKPKEVNRRYRNTALRGHAGRILCVGFVKEDSTGATEGVLTGDEPDILKAFWELAQEVDQFVGFNVLDFDLKFIWQRSVVNGIPPSREVGRRRFQSDQVYDVMQEWEMWSPRDHISLDVLTKALGIESPKGEITGALVYDFYLAGKTQEIYNYCLRDVKATREVYKKMTFVSSKHD